MHKIPSTTGGHARCDNNATSTAAPAVTTSTASARTRARRTFSGLAGLRGNQLPNRVTTAPPGGSLPHRYTIQGLYNSGRC